MPIVVYISRAKSLRRAIERCVCVSYEDYKISNVFCVVAECCRKTITKLSNRIYYDAYFFAFFLIFLWRTINYKKSTIFMKRLLNAVRKGNATDVENELFLDNSNTPLLRNKNYIIKKNTSGSNNIISYSATSNRTNLTSDNLNGDNSLYNAYKKEVNKLESLLNEINDLMNAEGYRPEDLKKFGISEVN